MNLLKHISLCLAVAASLTACLKPADKNSISVGTISGPETELLITAKRIAAEKYHLTINIIEFSDYSLPNTALRDNSIDANVFQHKAYLDTDNHANGNDLTVIGKTFVYPMAIYSSKITHISDIQQNAIVAIPNDTSNEARALLLLSKANLIKLKPGSNSTATPQDIISNPKHLQIKELDAAQLPRVLPDIEISIINTNYAMLANLQLKRDAIFVEDRSSPYANLIVSRTGNANDPRLKLLVKAYQSPAVEDKAKEIFQDQAIAAWK